MYLADRGFRYVNCSAFGEPDTELMRTQTRYVSEGYDTMKKNMLLIWGVIFLLSAAATSAKADGFEDYQYNPAARTGGPVNWGLVQLPYSPIATPGGTAAMWTNPAGIGIDGGSGLLLGYGITAGGEYVGNGIGGTFGDLTGNLSGSGWQDDYLLGVNLGNFSYGLEVSREYFFAERHTIGLSLPFGEGFYLGGAYHWTKSLDREGSWDFGALVRPTRWASIGVQVSEADSPVFTFGDADEPQPREIDPTYRVGLAVRPLTDRRLTLTADAVFQRNPVQFQKTVNDLPRVIESYNGYDEDIEFTFTADWQPVSWVALRGGYAIESETVFAGVSIFSSLSESATWLSMPGDDNGPVKYDQTGLIYSRTSSQYRPDIMSLFVKKNWVHMTLKGEYVEEEDPFSFFGPQRETLWTLIQRIERATEDDEVRGMLLEIKGFSMGYGDRYELRQALERFKAAGKTLAVYSQGLTMGGYYVASVADHLMIHPSGSIAIPGFWMNRFYLKNMLAKLGIEAQFLQEGKYKSAGELFTREEASEPASEALEAVLETMWQHWVETVAADRDLSRAQLEELVDGAIYTAREAQETGLIDEIAYHDQVRDEIEKQAGYKPRLLPEMMYYALDPAPRHWDDMTSPKIAVVYAVGTITPGESGSNFLFGDVMGSESVAKAIRQARADKRVKAIVFRVDSPGGSAQASDVILREIERTVGDVDDDSRKIPVIVSMSDVAGSGGYWISAKADKILAPPMCITGSIGVIGGKFSFDTMYDSVGITWDSMKRGENADIFTTTRLWDERQKEIIQNSMHATYEQFLTLVAEGRGMDRDRVHELAQGRIWSGEDALDRNLVDEIGGLMEAIDAARHAAGIEDVPDIDVKLYKADGGFDLEGDVQAAVMAKLPPKVRAAMSADEIRELLNDGEPLLLTPVFPERGEK
ncbi:signal peptide peptidase SppA [bacterium]|nr:signal peptide peptidase SppA [bacterium]